ncbi:Inosine/uridine-preferring nucleoside hydrolase domain-containing protein [Phyllosticta citribraziliensis]|uniref:Inosine/uridine-preferring nucleoside hydrolase domain-containing protein n=1 Tax=Phyllosticta citribraziliensis TaxID=989973 RepID=A0ABR1LPU6_9PEZI
MDAATAAETRSGGANRVIIDTDPGVDDVLALLLALSARSDELEVLGLTLTWGNIDVENCLRNVVSMFHWIEKEMEWRKERGQPEGFETLRKTKPFVAVGAQEPLADQIVMADYFHGVDGLGGIHSSHPHLSPEETWKDLFASALSSTDQETREAAQEAHQPNALFTPSNRRAHHEILRVLKENEPNTISIVAIGPLTNLALAAAEDPETFLRVKEVIVMGGAIKEMGNVTPVAEFNVYADSVAAARVFALTSPTPATTMPPPAPPNPSAASSQPHPKHLGPYPQSLSRTLKLVLFPLDITETHALTSGQFTALTSPLLSTSSSPSPLATWVTVFVNSTFAKINSLAAAPPADAAAVALALHDPLTVWYALSPQHAGWKAATTILEGKPVPWQDIRVETAGQWTRGMCVVDERPLARRTDGPLDAEVPGDAGNWLSEVAGNRVTRMVGSPGPERFGSVLLGRIFGVEV